jgi:hypothetical protein
VHIGPWPDLFKDINEWPDSQTQTQAATQCEFLLRRRSRNHRNQRNLFRDVDAPATQQLPNYHSR